LQNYYHYSNDVRGNRQAVPRQACLFPNIEEGQMGEKQQYMDLIRGDPFLSRLMMSYDKASAYAKGKTVLDYGCGYGWGSYLLSGHAQQVMGYDPDDSRVQFARATFQEKNITYLTDADCLPGRCFDMACLFLVLPCAEDPWKVLEHTRECLIPGGILWLSFKSGDDWVADLVARWGGRKNAQLLYSGRRYLSKAADLVEQVLRIG